MSTLAHPYRNADDEWILDQVRRKNQVAAAELYRRYHLYTRSLALNTGANRSDVDDIVAETWTRIFTRLAHGGGPTASFRRYLGRAVHNTAVDQWRRQRRIVLTDELQDVPTPTPHHDADHDPDRELLADALAALTSLPAAQRQLLTASFAGDSYRTAEHAGVTSNALANRLSRARKALRRAYYVRRAAT